MTTSETVYELLHKIIPMEVLRRDGYVKLKAKGFMDLSVDLLCDDGHTYLAMAHNFEQNGDLVPDPDMGVMLDHEKKTAMPTHIQTQFGYREAKRPKEARDQLSFLRLWCANLIAQGHSLSENK